MGTSFLFLDCSNFHYTSSSSIIESCSISLFSQSGEQSHNSVQGKDGIAFAQEHLLDFEHFDLAHLHFTKFIIASGAGGLLVIIGLYELSSSIYQPKFNGDGMSGFATISLFHIMS
jgi:hypothetical protein